MLDNLRVLEPFLGLWNGNGSGEFPGITSFTYQERFDLKCDGEGDKIYLEQTAFSSAEHESSDTRLHWETGTILVEGEDIVACLTHSGGRFEKLKLTVVNEVSPLTLEWHSLSILNDVKMPDGSSSMRRWTLDAGVLSYAFYMSTKKVQDVTFHLKADLYR